MSGYSCHLFLCKTIGHELRDYCPWQRNNNALKILPESEEARAILKEEFKENIKTDCQ